MFWDVTWGILANKINVWKTTLIILGEMRHSWVLDMNLGCHFLSLLVTYRALSRGSKAKGHAFVAFWEKCYQMEDVLSLLWLPQPWSRTHCFVFLCCLSHFKVPNSVRKRLTRLEEIWDWKEEEFKYHLLERMVVLWFVMKVMYPWSWRLTN